MTENHLRIRLSPEVTIAMGMTVMAPGGEMVGQTVEMLASHSPQAGEMDEYERVLGDPYETNTWGPSEVERVISRGGWHNPTNGEEAFTIMRQSA